MGQILDEELYRSLFDHSEDGVLLTSPDGSILAANPTACRMLGRSEEDLKQIGRSGVLDPSDTRLAATLAVRERTGRVRAELTYVRADGTKFPVELTSSVFLDSKGNARTAIIFRDMSERQRIEQEREQYFRFFTLSTDPMCIADPFGCFKHVNPAFVRLTGYSEAELLAKPFLDFVLPGDRQKTLDEMKLQVSSRPSMRFENHYVCKNGNVALLSWTAYFDKKDGVTYAIARDISERRRREEELRRFRTAMDATADAIYLVDRASMRFIDVNDGACRMQGMTRKELLALGPSRLLSTPREELERIYDSVIAGGAAAAPLQVLRLRKDGSQVWVEIRRHAKRSAEGWMIVTVARDITARKATEDARAQLAAIVENSNDAIISRSVDGIILTWNAAAEELFGYAASEVIGQPITVILPPDHAADPDLHSAVLLGGGKIPPTEVVRRTKDGRRIELLRSISPIKNESGRIVGAAIIARDITERKRTERALIEAEEMFRQLAGNIPELYWVRDVQTKVLLYISPAWEKIIGRPAPAGSEMQALLECVHPEDVARMRRAMADFPQGGADEECRTVHSDGSIHWLHIRTFPIRNQAGDIYRVAGVAEDITERKNAEERLLQMAHYDALTNLPNRTLFYDSLKRTLGHAERNLHIVGVLFIDLDRFKVVNDTLGHATGDALLQQVATRLVESVRIRDVVGRLGGDEFALILPALDSAEDAAGVAQKVIESFAQPFDLEGREVFISASVGITVYPADTTDADSLMRYADTAMYRAKEEGRNAYRYYTAEMNARAGERLELENALRHALERSEFLLHYQPKLDLQTGEVSGVEALLRWQRPGGGLVSPMDFIPILEETGLIIAVGEWVIDESCRQICAWEQQGVKPVPIAVNLSGRQFHQNDLSEFIARAVHSHAVNPALLEFELTESSLMSHAEETIRILKELKRSGTSISVDDFGTGYSSLAYLKRFPINVIKIDRSFVRDIMTDWEDASLTLAVIGIAHSLGMKVVAEGVETLEQLEFLAKNGCNEIQGYVFHRPLSSTEITKLLREHDVSESRSAALGQASFRGRFDAGARIAEYEAAVRHMQGGILDSKTVLGQQGETGQPRGDLSDLAQTLEQRYEETRKLQQLVEDAASGLLLEDILNRIYDSFHGFIPYDRICCALLSGDKRTLAAHWVKSAASTVMLGSGYAAPLAGGSLQQVLDSRKPRIMNDLETYAVEHPHSAATMRIVAEGMRSSLTCPLVAQGKPVGFLFFSSMRKHTYRNLHQDIFLRIAGQLSVLIERTRLYERIDELDRELQVARRALAERAGGATP